MTQGLLAPKDYSFEKKNVLSHFSAAWQGAYCLDTLRKTRYTRQVEDKNAVLTRQVAGVQQELNELKAAYAQRKDDKRKELENIKTASEEKIEALNGRVLEYEMEIVRLKSNNDFERRSATVLSEIEKGVKVMVNSAINDARAAVPEAVVAAEAMDAPQRVSKADLEVVVHQVCYLN